MAVGTDFASVLEAFADKINAHTYTQQVPGMDHDDIRQELTYALWKAYTTFDPEAGTDLGQWWWVVWITTKTNLIEAFFRQKRTGHRELKTTNEHLEVLAMELGDSLAPLVTVADLCPSTSMVDRAVWLLLAVGYQGTEVRNMLGLSVRRFYTIVESWRTAEVRAILHCT